MRASIILLLVLMCGAAQTAAAQESLLNVYCQECRNITLYPEDARNFAVNQLYGSASWLSFDLADRFQITDSFGNTITVDINAKLNLAFSDLPDIGLPGIIPLADTIILQVRLVYADGNVLWYAFDLLDLDPNGTLPVPLGTDDGTFEGDTSTTTASGTGTWSSGGGSGGLYSYVDRYSYWGYRTYDFGDQLRSECRAYFPIGSADAGVVCPHPN
jgi:hypothetical protein